MAAKQNKNTKKKKPQLVARKKERTKKIILTATNKLFSEKPMTEVFLEDIAEAALVSRTTLYNYFTNKDGLIFALGTHLLSKEAKKITEKAFSNDLPGNKQVLVLCELIFKSSIEQPTINLIVREFFKRIGYLNLTLEEMEEGTLEHTELVRSIENPYLRDFYIQLSKNTHFWTQAVRNGKRDKSIRTNMDAVQIVQFLHILTGGIIGELELRKNSLTRVNLERDTVLRNSLILIAQFLKSESTFDI